MEAEHKPDYLADMNDEIVSLIDKSLDRAYKYELMDNINPEEWYVILVKDKILTCQGRTIFESKHSATSRLSAFVNRQNWTVENTFSQKLIQDEGEVTAAKYPEYSDRTAEYLRRKSITGKLTKEALKAWKQDNTQIITLKEYREKNPNSEI